MDTNLPDPIIASRPDELKQVVAHLNSEPIVAVDTESNSLYAYREQVCLIQFSTAHADYLVDPLALDDLSLLAPIFANPRVEKVFHAAEYDMICLRRDFGFEIHNLFDTMMAARLLARNKVGLHDLLQAEFGVSTDKRCQKSNWGQRPLPPLLLSYARVDTHYLIPLRDRLRAELVARDLWPLAAEDLAHLCRVPGRSTNGDPTPVWRVTGARDLTPRQAAVLSELCAYRDEVARSLDRPLFKILGDSTLTSIASACPTSLNQVKSLPGMTERQIRRHGQPVLQAVQRGLKLEPLYPPRSPRPDEQYLARLEALREWRKETARGMGVESDIVLPRDLLCGLAERNPQQPHELAELLQDVPWRLERFGDQILGVLRGSP
ncbi:MAG: HRDC domain-containing protein [Armatimonadetes bacterium]|nr:HRDC domain-containing protein [Armatimonadota bacterium]